MKKFWVFLLMIIGISLFFTSCKNPNDNTKQTIKVETPKVTEQQPVKNIVNLTFAGCVLFHDGLIASGNLGNGKYDFNYMFEDIKPQIQRGDIGVACLETSMRTDWKPTGYPCFNTPPQALDALKNAGFGIINLANNHVVDTGSKGLYGLFDNIKSRGMQYFGSGTPEEDKIAYVEKNGIKFAFIGYTYGTNGIKAPDGTVNYIDESKIKQDIQKAKAQSDFVIVWMHMGSEYVRKPENEQITMYRKVADMGADCVVESHPHVPKKSEVYNSNGREVPIFYALGNFISAQRQAQDKYAEVGLVAHMTVMQEVTGSQKSTSIVDMDTVPVYVLKNIQNGKWTYRVVECSKIDDYKEATTVQKNYAKEMYAELSKEHDFSVFKNNN